MRSWHPIPPKYLDRGRLLGEHNELYIMVRSIFGHNKRKPNHPETKRWIGRTKALKLRHDLIVEEMLKRGYNHKSPWPEEYIKEADSEDMPGLWEPLEVMLAKLLEKQGDFNGFQEIPELRESLSREMDTTLAG